MKLNKDKRLTKAHSRAHAAFDPLWRSGEMTRDEAYAWLREVMKTNPGHGHISHMTAEQAAELIEHCRRRRNPA